MTIEPFDMKCDDHLFLETIIVIGEKKSRDLFQPLASSCCLQKQMNIELHVENVYFVVTSINPFVPTVPTFAVRETASLGQQMLELGCENATVGKNGLNVM